MCGLTGIFKLNGDPVSANEVKVMADAIAHRGPDSEGIFIDENIGLGHRRLAILDTSPKGAQPMASHNGEWVIIFNGCIYNFIELKLDLQSKGHNFISHSDTEVIAEGLSAYGPDFFAKLDGMFAIAAWNKTTKELWLSRDRYGIKPLYYFFQNDTLLFASEIKAFLKSPFFKVEVNLEALNEYFTFQNLFSFHTLFKGVYMLPPANTTRIAKGTTFVKHNSWWDYDFTKPDNSMSFEDAKSETERLLAKAVSKQMISTILGCLANFQLVDTQKARVDRLVPKGMRSNGRRSRDHFSHRVAENAIHPRRFRFEY